MKNLKTTLIAAFLATTSLFAAQPAQAGCYPSLAANEIADLIRAGAPDELAIQSAIDNGYLDSKQCMRSVVDYWRQYTYIFSDIVH